MKSYMYLRTNRSIFFCSFGIFKFDASFADSSGKCNSIQTKENRRKRIDESQTEEDEAGDGKKKRITTETDIQL